jgi:hypothetical protein
MKFNWCPTYPFIAEVLTRKGGTETLNPINQREENGFNSKEGAEDKLRPLINYYNEMIITLTDCNERIRLLIEKADKILKEGNREKVD